MNPTVFLVRHGQSQANVGGITIENPIVPLTDLGERQARTLAPLLPAVTPRICSSPFKRALDTAAPYCARIGKAPVLHAELREFETIDTVSMRGTPFSERNAAVLAYWRTSDPDLRSGPAAETFREFHTRVSHLRSTLLPSLPDGTVVFGHGLCMALLFWQMWGFEQVDHLGMVLFRRFQLGFATPNTAVYSVRNSAPGRWEVKVEERAMRAIAEIMQGVEPADGKEEQLDAHGDAEGNTEIESAGPLKMS